MLSLSAVAGPAAPAVLKTVLAALGVAASSYMLGSVVFAILFTRLFKKQDIRTLGSGNAGTVNVFRSAGFWPGALTGVFDFAKGVCAVYIGYWLFEWAGFGAYTGGCFAALFVLIGHLYPLFFNYRGGKGVMTVAGIMVVLNWRAFLILVALFALVLAVTKISSVASLAAATCLPVANAVLLILERRSWIPTTAYLMLIVALLWFTHRDNLNRLRAGRENRAYVRRDDPPGGAGEGKAQ